jgi:hypothetical protein
MTDVTDSALTVVNLGLVAFNLWLVFKQYATQIHQFEYQRKPQIIVQISSTVNRVTLKLRNQGTVTANNISLNVDVNLDDEQASIGKFSLVSLNPNEETGHDITEYLFARLEKKKHLHSYYESVPAGKDEITNDALWEDIIVHHVRQSQVSCDLTVSGSYGTDVNPKPIFTMDYVFRIDLKRREYDYSSGGEGYQYDDDFETTVSAQTGTWEPLPV